MAEITLTDSNFKDQVLEASKTTPVLVDFWASWCGPCQAMSPVIDELNQEFEGKLVVAKYNVEDWSEAAGRYGVMSIPTFIIFKKGKPFEQWAGMTPKEEIVTKIKKAIG